MIQAALETHNQNIFACIQLVSELFWCDSREFELAHKALPPCEPAHDVEAETCCQGERNKGCHAGEMIGNVL
jgi:hypothetical protein